jgi:hypothetical protein
MLLPITAAAYVLDLGKTRGRNGDTRTDSRAVALHADESQQHAMVAGSPVSLPEKRREEGNAGRYVASSKIMSFRI